MQRFFSITVIFLIGYNFSYAQKEDYNWIIGRHTKVIANYERNGINIFNFNNDPVEIIRSNEIESAFQLTCSMLSDKTGKLLAYSNGMHILGSDFKPLVGGEKINYNSYWNLFRSTYADGSDRLEGLRIPQGMIMLPFPSHDSIIWIANNYHNFDGTIFNVHVKGLFYGIIDTVNQTKVVKRDINFFTDSLAAGSIHACKHANGRDWWIICSGYNLRKYYTFLLDPSGIKLKQTTLQPIDYLAGSGQGIFSPDGTKFISYQVVSGIGYTDQGHMIIYDFDRCTGELINLEYEKFKGRGSYAVGCAISENSKYLYAANGIELFQYDLESADIFASKKLVTYSDGFHSKLSETDSVENNFHFLALAPDGKIYGPGGNTLHMHRIEYPDENYQECEVKQHAINTFYNLLTIPNHPYFRLGPEDGSDCDTLGIDNHPIAKFRYEGDTTNHLNVRFTDLSYFRPETWHWDFGDGITFEGRKPYWHEFPKNGTYNVCLTVSNENSENTMCRLVIIGSTSNEELKVKNEKLVSLFPNPTEGEVLLTISDYIPEHGVVYFYDMMGREVFKQRVYYGWNNLNLNALDAGTYIYIVKDKTQKIFSGKLIKI